MGIVGAGRSTFVNALLSKCSSQLDRMEVGDKLDPCTITAKHSIIPSEDLTRILGHEAKYRLVLVDTPGFDAGNQTDSDGVLREIMNWSRNRYVRSLNRGLRGTIYFRAKSSPSQ
ncbi:hypothetical protein FA13DRAFT_1743834 [Coprinellus micaceus]|uniref:Septin-type G domain-containing protein n=1 Tax=Coprinellus micaceus TaxID=71717 RepID=A0A4Y7SE08_COPMI|nr:hypothetical protein FA13DRAFT_1743834 [Coprinellus micaceus]